MKCALCGTEVETIDKAILNNWIQYFCERDKEYGPVCCLYAETMIDIGEDGEMELKAEYRGKVQYMDGDYTYQTKEKDLVIEVFLTEENKERSH